MSGVGAVGRASKRAKIEVPEQQSRLRQQHLQPQQRLNRLNSDVLIHMIKFMRVEERIKFSKTSRQNHQLVIDSFKQETIDLSNKPINDADLELFKECKGINLEGCR